MKTVLRTGLFMVLLATAFTPAKAQCDASSILIQNITQVGTQTPGSCRVTFDLSFEMANNNGNKFIFLHGWARESYPDFFDCVDGSPGGNGAIRPPEGDDLTAAFVNIGIDNSGATPVLLTTYTPDPGFTLSTASTITRTVLPNGNAFFVITGVTATLPVDCGEAFVIAFDFWSSQAAQAQSAQCVNCNVLYAVNYIAVTGLANCFNLTFSGVITNNSDTTISGYTLVYADVNNDGFLAEGVDVLVQDTTQFTIAPGPGTTAAIAGVINPLYINMDLLVVTSLNLEGSEGAAQVDEVLSTQCGGLPVTFKMFTANRSSRTSVQLKWETASEIDNKGFSIQRNMGGNVWEEVAFINSQATDGNSSTTLTYTFSDANSNRGMSQYRIKQVDRDGRFKFSEIRSVRGDGQSNGIVVYPVPTTNGRVNVVFDDMDATRDVLLSDMNGRVIKQWKGITNNTLQVENLKQGVYTLRIHNLQSGEVVAKKIIVTNN
ncbi:MAG TPA: T9SS type A sorting domain-containing protein [Chitinophagaceae bacterium]